MYVKYAPVFNRGLSIQQYNEFSIFFLFLIQEHNGSSLPDCLFVSARQKVRKQERISWI